MKNNDYTYFSVDNYMDYSDVGGNLRFISQIYEELQQRRTEKGEYPAYLLYIHGLNYLEIKEQLKVILQ